jgi:heme A synthase
MNEHPQSRPAAENVNAVPSLPSGARTSHDQTKSEDAVETINLEFHRYAAAVVLSTLILIAIGAYITSQAAGRQPVSHGLVNAVIHRDAAVAVIILAVGLALWLSAAQEAPFLGWIAAGFLVLDGWLGWLGQPLLHATLAPLAFSILLAIALLSSSRWNDMPELVHDPVSPLLRRLAIAGPPLVLLQILLGAAYRHKLTGVIPHLIGAMIVSTAILVAATQVMQHHPLHRGLRSAAMWLISILLVQVILGVTTFAMQLLDVEDPIAVILVSSSHVVVGSLTLAASLVLAMQIQRNVRQVRGPN